MSRKTEPTLVRASLSVSLWQGDPRGSIRSSLKKPPASAKMGQLLSPDARSSGAQRFPVFLPFDRGVDPGQPSAASDPETGGSCSLDRLNPSFCELYAAEGRPSVPPEQLLLASLLQVY